MYICVCVCVCAHPYKYKSYINVEIYIYPSIQIITGIFEVFNKLTDAIKLQQKGHSMT